MVRSLGRSYRGSPRRPDRRPALAIIRSWQGNLRSLALCAGACPQAWSAAPKVGRGGAPFKDWILPASLARVRKKLGSTDDGDRQMVKILATVLTDGLPAVEAACGEALGDGVHSADVILNILARQRDVIQPLTIVTPLNATVVPRSALKLQHEPVAAIWTVSGARYDRLRRAV